MFARALLCASVAAAVVASAAEPASIVSRIAAHPDGRAPWTLDLARARAVNAAAPIGVFDSGIGGLTVLEAILRIDAFHNDTLQPGADGRPDFAGECFVYFGDQANLPYGNYPAQGREDFLRELIVKDAVFLLGTRWRDAPAAEPRFDKPPVKAIVIACNTATAYGLEDIRAALRAWQIEVPVIGVVEAGAREVATALPDDAQRRSVAVLATVGTCASGAYPKAIGQAVGRAGKLAPTVVQQGSVSLASVIEGHAGYITREATRAVPYQGPSPANAAAPLDPNFADAYGFDPAGLRHAGDALELNSVANYARYDVTSMLAKQRPADAPPIDTVVLGCTHFPLATKEIAEAFERARTFRAADGSQPFATAVAPTVRFIDPSEATARELFRELARARLRQRGNADTKPTAEFFFSVPNARSPGVPLTADGAFETAYKIGRTPGNLDREDTEVIPLTPQNLPAAVRPLVQSLPNVWGQLDRAPQRE